MLRRSSGSDPRPSLRRAEAVWTRRGSRDSPHPPTKEGPGPQKSQPVPAHCLGLLQTLLTITCPFPPPGPAFPGETQFNSKGKLSWQSELPTSFLKKKHKITAMCQRRRAEKSGAGHGLGWTPSPRPQEVGSWPAHAAALHTSGASKSWKTLLLLTGRRNRGWGRPKSGGKRSTVSPGPCRVLSGQHLPLPSSHEASPSGSQAEPGWLHHCWAKAGPDLSRMAQLDTHGGHGHS